MVTYISACTRWQVQEASPEQFIAEAHPKEIRVTTTDGTELVVKEPWVSGDSLIWRFHRYNRVTGIRVDSTVSIPLTDVTRVATRKRPSTAVVIVALTVAIPFLGVGGIAMYRFWRDLDKL